MIVSSNVIITLPKSISVSTCITGAMLALSLLNGALSMGNGSSSRLHDSSPRTRRENVVARINELYNRVFDANASQPISGHEMISRLKEMEKLLRYPESSQVDNRREIENLIGTINLIKTDKGCLLEDLSTRIALERRENERLNLSRLIKFYNRKHFERCAKNMDASLNRFANQAYETTSNINRTSQLIRRKLAQERGESNIATVLADIDFRLISQGVIEHLKDNLGFDVEKSVGFSMNVHTNQMASMIENVYKNECLWINIRHQMDLQIYLTMLAYNPELKQKFRSRVARFLENMTLCTPLLLRTQYIYPLGQFDLQTLTDKIFDTEQYDFDNHGHMSPQRMADLLEIGLFVGQAELTVTNNVNEILMQKLLDLFTASQIDPSKCQSSYFAIFVNLKQTNRGYPNLLNYLDHYGKLQLTECLRLLESVLRFDISTIGEGFLRGDPGSILLNELVEILEETRINRYSNVRLYDSGLPDDMFGLGINRFMEKHGFSILDPGRDDNLKPMQDKARQLFDFCRSIRVTLKSSAKRFRYLVQLDSGPESVISPFVVHWMTRHAICVNLLKLPQTNVSILGIGGSRS